MKLLDLGGNRGMDPALWIFYPHIYHCSFSNDKGSSSWIRSRQGCASWEVGVLTPENMYDGSDHASTPLKCLIFSLKTVVGQLRKPHNMKDERYVKNGRQNQFFEAPETVWWLGPTNPDPLILRPLGQGVDPGVWGVEGVLPPWKYVSSVFQCLQKMSHSFIQICCWITLQLSRRQEWRLTVKNGR